MEIAVIGLGYVGMSLAVLLSRHHTLRALDIDPARVDRVNRKTPTVADADMSEWMSQFALNLRATTDPAEAITGADFVIIATPTNYDDALNHFDTSTVESAIRLVRQHSATATIVIKSTIPVGFVEAIRAETGDRNLFFSPEFLREGKALHDNLHPSRIVVGDHGTAAATFAGLLRDASMRPDVPILQTGASEAEAIKLFANTYLAMRVAYFNELDSFGMARGLSVREMIDGVCLDPRIGAGYNNPSFGYGGYCLPKDTKQLLANYEGVPEQIIHGIVRSNEVRKDFLAEVIADRSKGTIGIYRLAMKAGSDNMRSSAIQGLVERLVRKGRVVTIYEPLLEGTAYLGARVETDFDTFAGAADLIVCNRIDDTIRPFTSKIFTRDLFEDN